MQDAINKCSIRLGKGQEERINITTGIVDKKFFPYGSKMLGI